MYNVKTQHNICDDHTFILCNIFDLHTLRDKGLIIFLPYQVYIRYRYRIYRIYKFLHNIFIHISQVLN